MQERKTMHVKILSLLYHLPQVVGYLKFKKKTQKYHTSQDVVVVKNFEKNK